MEIKVSVSKAQGVDDKAVPDMIIQAFVEVPKWSSGKTNQEFLTEARNHYMREAKDAVRAMLGCLPGGLIDAILVELLDHKRSVFSVPFGGKK